MDAILQKHYAGTGIRVVLLSAAILLAGRTTDAATFTVNTLC
jgi:hypothetical protein